MQTQQTNPAHAFLEDKRDLVHRARVLGGEVTAPPFVLVLVDRTGASMFRDLFGDAFRSPSQVASCAVVPLSGLGDRLGSTPAADGVRQRLASHVPGPVAPTLVAACSGFYFDDGGSRGQA